MKLKNTLIAATLLLSITSTQAALVESDWENTGDGLATLDTDTGIEWLDLTQTDGMSLNQAEGLTGAGGIFDGWRLPTRAEVTQMMVNAFSSEASQIPILHSWGVSNTTINDEAHDFRMLFGNTAANTTTDYSAGLLKNDAGQTYSVIYSGVSDTKDNDYIVLTSNSNVTNDYNYTNINLGVYLVSNGGTTLSSQLDPGINVPSSDVYGPSFLGLMGLGLLGFAARRRL
jgi:hypothetical protein